MPCDPCNCSDLRLDYAMDSASGPFDTEMVAMTLHSTAPIVVGNTSGIDSFFDVWVEISADGGGLSLELESVSNAVAGAENASWGAMKSRFR